MTRASNRLYYKQNRLKQLRAFCCAAQTGSISKAAERLHLSQPSVTLQIQALERELGVTLFERRGPKIQLTPDGRSLYETSQPLVHGIDTLSETFAANSGQVSSGELSIAAGESTLLYCCPFITFSDKYRASVSSCKTSPAAMAWRCCAPTKADFAVGSFIEIRTTSPTTRCSLRPMLIVPSDHPLPRKQAAAPRGHQSARFDPPPRHLSTWSVVQPRSPARPGLSRPLEAGGWEIVKNMSAGTLYLDRDGIVSPGREPGGDTVDRYFPETPYGVSCAAQFPHARRARLFIEMLDPFSSRGHGTKTHKRLDCSRVARLLLFNKPYGVLTQFTDSAGRDTLASIVP